MVFAMATSALAGTSVWGTITTIGNYECRSYMAIDIGGDGTLCGGTYVSSTSTIASGAVAVRANLYKDGARVATSTPKSSNGTSTTLSVITGYESNYGEYYARGEVKMGTGAWQKLTQTNPYYFYGSARTLNEDAEAEGFDEVPEGLLLAYATNGELGYIKAIELDNAVTDGYIPVYAADGNTIIGQYPIVTIEE